VALASPHVVREWTTAMRERFTLEARGIPKHLLGMDISWNASNSCVSISGEGSIRALASEEGVTRTASTLYLAGTKTLARHCPAVASSQPALQLPAVKAFQVLIGRLLFIARMWRLSVRYAVQRLCTKASKPSEQD